MGVPILGVPVMRIVLVLRIHCVYKRLPHLETLNMRTPRRGKGGGEWTCVTRFFSLALCWGVGGRTLPVGTLPGITGTNFCCPCAAPSRVQGRGTLLSLLTSYPRFYFQNPPSCTCFCRKSIHKKLHHVSMLHPVMPPDDIPTPPTTQELLLQKRPSAEAGRKPLKPM